MSQSAKQAEETLRSFKNKIQGSLPSLIDAAFAVGLTAWLILLIRSFVSFVDDFLSPTYNFFFSSLEFVLYEQKSQE